MRRVEFRRGWFGPLTDDRRCLALLIVIQLVVTAVVQPHGDFPQNDDWAYAAARLGQELVVGKGSSLRRCILSVTGVRRNRNAAHTGYRADPHKSGFCDA